MVLSHRGVFSPPDGYRERMKFFDFPKRRLRVWTLDKYDLAISKIGRGLGKDYEDILRIHEISALDYDKLLEIFTTEFLNIAAVGSPRTLMMNFLDLTEKLYGRELMEKTKSKIGFE